MTDNEVQKHNVIKKVVNKEMTQKEVMIELNKSRQQIYRLIKKYNEEGKQGFIHKNRGRILEKRIDASIIDELKQLYLTEYYDYNIIAFYDVLNENKKVNITSHIHLCIMHSLMMI